MRIPVVFAADENYLFYTLTAVTSMVMNASEDTFYQVYILVPQKTGLHTGSFAALEQEYAGRLSVCFLQAEERIFQNVRIHNGHVTAATFYRLVLPDILEEEKCIYLDSDLIVTEDLAELYHIPLTDAYLAGARDIWIDLMRPREREERRKRTRIPSLAQYVNAGVLLMNLDRMRRDHMSGRFLEHMGHGYLFEDQDVLNVCCYGGIRPLPQKWNIFTYFHGKEEALLSHGISQDTVRQMHEGRGILHYATPFIRPWDTCLFWKNRLWWEYAGRWKGTPEYAQTEHKRMEKERSYSWSRTLGSCQRYERIVLFGFNQLAVRWGRIFENAGIGHKVTVCDNDEKKWGASCGNLPITPVSAALYQDTDVCFLVTAQNSRMEIMEALREAGVGEGRIFYCSQKDREYYACLLPEFYMEELSDLWLAERGVEMVWTDRKEAEKELVRPVYSAWRQRYCLDAWILKEIPAKY